MSDFTDLIKSEIPKLRRYARALTRDPVRADDLVQSALVRAITKQHLWQPGTNLRAWLFTILHHQTSMMSVALYARGTGSRWNALR